MSKIAVLYKSTYGNTKQYAEWIADDLRADIHNIFRLTLSDLNQYDTIIFGGSLIASKISGFSFISKNYAALAGKNIIVFTTGITATDDTTALTAVINKNFTPQMKSEPPTGIKHFHLPGCVNFKSLSITHRILMFMLNKGLNKKTDKTPQDKLLINAYGKKLDLSNKSYIKPLTLYVRSLKNK